jgi:hypothetical protein
MNICTQLQLLFPFISPMWPNKNSKSTMMSTKFIKKSENTHFFFVQYFIRINVPLHRWLKNKESRTTKTNAVHDFRHRKWWWWIAGRNRIHIHCLPPCQQTQKELQVCVYTIVLQTHSSFTGREDSVIEYCHREVVNSSLARTPEHSLVKPIEIARDCFFFYQACGF